MYTLTERISRPLVKTTRWSDMRQMVQVVFVHLGRNARVFTYYKVHTALQLLQGLAQVAIFLFLGRMIGMNHIAGLMGGSYASYFIIGVVLLQCLDKSLIAPYVSLSGAYWSTRLESLLLSPYSLWLFILSDTAWYYLMTTINAVAMVCVGLFFGASIGAPSSWSAAVLVFVLGAVAVLGLGLISASTFSLLNAKGNDEPLGWGIHLLQGLVTGLYFPVMLLPHFMQYVGLLLPHTYAIDSMRRLFLSHSSPPSLLVHQWFGADPIIVNIGCLCACIGIYMPLGIHLFARGMKKSREVGSLSRWS